MGKYIKRDFVFQFCLVCLDYFYKIIIFYENYNKLNKNAHEPIFKLNHKFIQATKNIDPCKISLKI